VQKNLIKEFTDKGWDLSSLKKITELFEYFALLFFASFFLASHDVIS